MGVKTVGDQDSPKASDYYVWSLPGLDPSTTQFHEMHAGNIVIKPEHHGSLFFWHVAAQFVVDEPKTIIWLNGGPGCSSFDGALMEIGPYRLKDEDTLEDNPGSWNKFSDLLFIDQPVGTGLSTIDTDSYVGDLQEMAEDILTFLDKYFGIFPEKLHSQLYIAGESYAGQYIPYISKAILDRNKLVAQSAKKPPFYYNLKGVMIGNGWIDPVQQYLAYLPFSYEHGLLESGTEWANKIERGHIACSEELQNLENVTISVESCDAMVNSILRASNSQSGGQCLNVYDMRYTDSYPSCGMNWPPDLVNIKPYLHKKEVLEALNSYSRSAKGWEECNGQVGDAMRDHMVSSPSVKLLPELVESIEVTMFNGDQDFVCNHLGNENLIKNLFWKGQQGFSEKAETIHWNVSDEPAGTVVSDRNLNYVLFYNSSHMVPYDNPEASLHMVNALLGIKDWAGDDELTHVSPGVGFPSHKDGDADKLVSDATWRAYYRAGETALVVVLIIVLIFGFSIWRSRTRRHMLGNMPEAGKSNLFLSFVGGLTRWKPKRGRSDRYRDLRYSSNRIPSVSEGELYNDNNDNNNNNNDSPYAESGSELEELVVHEPFDENNTERRIEEV